jgi:mannosyltransferase
MVRLTGDGPLATDEPEGHLWRKYGYAVENPNAPRINATLLALVRNEEVDGMVQSMRDLERTWNSKFNYPWTFFNDVPFNEEFKRKTQAETRAKCFYGVPKKSILKLRQLM